MNYHEYIFNKTEYNWGNNEVYLDGKTDEWKYYTLFNELRDMDYSMVQYMAWVMLESLEK